MKFFLKTSSDMPVNSEEYHEMECISNKLSKQKFFSAISSSGISDLILSEINKNKSLGEPHYNLSRFLGMPCLVLSLPNEDLFFLSNTEVVDIEERRNVMKDIFKKIENEILFIVNYELSSKRMSGYNEKSVAKSIENTVRAVVEDKGIRGDLFKYKIPLDYIYINNETPILSQALKKISGEILPNIPLFERGRRSDLQTSGGISVGMG